jgi:hypothetical protein
MEDKEKRLIDLIWNAKKSYSKEYFATIIPLLFSRKFIGYCGMHEDLKYCKDYIVELKKNPKTSISSALTSSLIGLYGRCFTDASNHKFPKLESSIFNKNDEYIKLHEYLMDLRHTFIAHRGESESEIGIALMLIPIEGDVKDSIMKFNQIKRSKFSKEQIVKIDKLLDYLMDEVKRRIQKSADKIHDSLFKNFTMEQLSMMVINDSK